ncbi:MAG TPA: glycosyltransferase, partial [Acidobacteriota bacterium]|nr:glycosyltransferase [Acidobacteriota bacterium]
GLSEPYLFFPAAFWPHKNHDRLVEALDLLRNEYKLPVHTVLCGSKAGRIRQDRCRQIVDLVHDRDLEEHVRFLGYVPDEEMAALYAGSRLVADLSLFGTQSVVVCEAWAVGRAVVAARIRGVREQVGDAGWLVDPLSVEEIAEGIRKLWTEPETRNRLADRGTALHRAFSLSDFSARLAGILKEAQARMESREES